MGKNKLYSICLVILLLQICAEGCRKKTNFVVNPHPHMLMLPEHKEIVLQRCEREPYKTMLERISATASLDYDPGDPEVYDSNPEGNNASIAQANALIAYLFDDELAGQKAVEFLNKIRTDFDTNQVYDIHIRMPKVVMGYINAWDLLLATPYINEEDANTAKSLIIELMDKFFSITVRSSSGAFLMHQTQNNYNIKVASSFIYAALAFPDAPQGKEWRNFSMSEFGFMLSTTSHYIQEDGGVSEGPFYFGFALESAIPALLAYKNTIGGPVTISRDCTYRTNVPPWDDIECIEGEPYTFINPLDGEILKRAVDWTIKIRLPSGDRPPFEDANFNPTRVVGILSGVWNEPLYAWDWKENINSPQSISDDPVYLVYYDDTIMPEEPGWTPTQFLAHAGNAMFRSDWGNDAIWFMMMAENGPVHMTVHDHVDDTSFQLYAFGEYLAMDPGYYKPNSLDNSVTAHAWNHNLTLIDNQGPPDKGLLTDFNDTDCFLENIYDGNIFDYAEARTRYQETDIVRSALFVRNRYVVVSDFLDASSSHEYSFRVHGYAGYDSGGTYTDFTLGGRWERPKAGLDVSVTSTAGTPSFAHPAYQYHASPNVHRFENNRQIADHVVLDAVVNGQDLSFLAVLYPYRKGSTDPFEMPAQVQEITAGSGLAALSITASDGKKDVILANRTGSSVSVSISEGVIETDASFAFVGLSYTPPIGFITHGTYLKKDGVPITTP